MTTKEVKRKLAAILSADVKGYSRLMSENEVGTIQTLNAYKEVMAGLIQRHRGRVVDAPGDNVLAEFGSVVDAVQCAVEIQKELKIKNMELPENRMMEFRIGVNLGDVVEDGEQILGDGVNIAARLENLSEAGGVCISGTVYENVENKLSLEYEYIGEQKVKNIARPVQVYRVLMEPSTVARRFSEVVSREKLVFPLPDKPSIAVLPFTNMSGEKELEYLSDGLAEGIINGLSKSDNIFVIARNSTSTYKGKPVKVKQVAEEMGVRYVIEGSVQQERNRVRITAQLIDALTGHHLFSERYDRELKDILNLQDEITLKVLTTVQVKLTIGEVARLYEKGTKNLEAYLKVLEAREYKGSTVNKERLQRAMQLLEEAIVVDPEYAYAYSILSTAHLDMVIIGASESPRASLQRALELGERAVALDDSNSTIHAMLTFPYIYLKEYDKAISEAEKAISLSPNSATAYFSLGTALSYAGRPQEGIPMVQKSLRLSPIPVNSWVLSVLAFSYRELGLYEEAIATYEKVLRIYGPDHLLAHLELAITYAWMDREKEERAEGAEVLRIDPQFSTERYIKLLPFDQVKKDRIAAALRKAGLK